MRKTLTQISTVFFLLFVVSTYAQTRDWQFINPDKAINKIELQVLDNTNFSVFQLDIENFKLKLTDAPKRKASNGQSNTIVQFPDVSGKLKQYRVVETQIFSSEDNENQHPDIKTYLGSRLDNSGTRVRFSVTPLGLNAMITEPGKENYYIQPATKVANGQYLIYNRNAKQSPMDSFECLTEDLNIPTRSERTTLNRDANDQVLRTFRIAISVTQEYTNFWDDGNNANGNNRADALAQMISTLNRTNEVFEVDMAITFQLVDTADDPALDLIYSPTFPDPYGGDLNGDLQTNLTATVGESDYDIGHLLAFGGNNGNAGCIGCVCTNGKGSGFSSHSFLDNDGGPYMADFFDIDYVPHEIGHQMGANHTWSFGSEGTGVNAEPGSGTTIMGYAGITGPDDIQDHSDPYFHFYSIDQILDNVTTSPNTCAVPTGITNDPPVADAGDDYIIPQGTAFILKGDATDPNGGDVLTYTWEQIDDGVTTNTNFGPTKTTGAVWRSRPPSVSPNRYMPILERVLAGQLTESNPVETVDNTSWETVSTVGRSLNFALTVRDRSEAGGVGQTPQSDFDFMTVTVDGTSGPFAVTSQTSNVIWDAGSTQTVTWDVAGTDIGLVNTPTVNILLSIDGGQTFPFTLASNIPNNGTADITVPQTGDTSEARVIVEGNNNIFYAVNSSDFTIQSSEFVITFDNTELDVCQPDNAIFNFTYNTFLGFTDTTTFSVNGLPVEVSAVINPTTASADGTTGTVTISGTGSLAEGSYPFTFEGNSGGINQTVDLTLNVLSNSLSSAVLTSPANGALGLDDEVDLMWTGDANAQDYLVEISTQSNFASIFDSATVQSTSYAVSGLSANTQYFWRVTASNLCGNASPSTVFNFTTANIICLTPSATDTPIAILETGNATDNYTSVITITDNEPVTDVNVTINIEHTWNNDLDIFLISPSGTVVELSTDNGDAGDDDYTNTVFDQEAVTPITSGTSPFTGTFIPEGDLSVLYGETSGGNWTLSVDDDFGTADGGQILEFTLELCIEPTLSVENVGIDTIDFGIYPNPNNGSFNVKLNNAISDRIEISVHDIRGRRIFKNSYENDSNFNQAITLNSVQSGMYLVTVKDGNQQVTKKIVIE
ncbi:reprolysin-like metallopeptidase [uncultured Psychroserpens sp.]|uniref:zinc-dependent metalloprotease n=1 Tax=uncultured Psychroserpens sp. TaxID=255436 RepID=UPI0026309262|nr:M12 family metallo-peptidase [uncultured Psychroserpens sp.]